MKLKKVIAALSVVAMLGSLAVAVPAQAAEEQAAEEQVVPIQAGVAYRVGFTDNVASKWNGSLVNILAVAAESDIDREVQYGPSQGKGFGVIYKYNIKELGTIETATLTVQVIRTQYDNSTLAAFTWPADKGLPTQSGDTSWQAVAEYCAAETTITDNKLGEYKIESVVNADNDRNLAQKVNIPVDASKLTNAADANGDVYILVSDASLTATGWHKITADGPNRPVLKVTATKPAEPTYTGYVVDADGTKTEYAAFADAMTAIQTNTAADKFTLTIYEDAANIKYNGAIESNHNAGKKQTLTINAAEGKTVNFTYGRTGTLAQMFNGDVNRTLNVGTAGGAINVTDTRINPNANWATFGGANTTVGEKVKVTVNYAAGKVTDAPSKYSAVSTSCPTDSQFNAADGTVSIIPTISSEIVEGSKVTENGTGEHKSQVSTGFIAKLTAADGGSISKFGVKVNDTDKNLKEGTLPSIASKIGETTTVYLMVIINDAASNDAITTYVE